MKIGAMFTCAKENTIEALQFTAKCGRWPEVDADPPREMMEKEDRTFIICISFSKSKEIMQIAKNSLFQLPIIGNIFRGSSFKEKKD